MDPAAQDNQNRELAEQLYDALMAEIEPELVLSVIPTLDAKYASEMPEQKAARMKRYEKAYKKFDAEFATFVSGVDQEVRTTKRTSLKNKESEERTKENSAISSIE